MEITGKKNATGIKCILKYIPYSYFTRDSQRRVKGVVVDVDSNVKFVVNGTWDDQVDIAPVTGSSDINSSIYETGQPIIAWKRRYPPPDAERYCLMNFNQKWECLIPYFAFVGSTTSPCWRPS